MTISKDPSPSITILKDPECPNQQIRSNQPELYTRVQLLDRRAETNYSWEKKDICVLTDDLLQYTAKALLDLKLKKKNLPPKGNIVGQTEKLGTNKRNHACPFKNSHKSKKYLDLREKLKTITIVRKDPQPKRKCVNDEWRVEGKASVEKAPNQHKKLPTFQYIHIYNIHNK